jgi:serine phosphatase RsbU (regulator of sigma subunit)/anti-sigma regulatory factor (Ser/Thr protein kinase)/HAMP domain-containing protein
MKAAGLRRSLARKYLAVLLGLVGGVLVASSSVEVYFSYQETKAALVRLERTRVVSAARQIEQYFRGIHQQLRGTLEGGGDDSALGSLERPAELMGDSRAAAIAGQRQIDFNRLLRNVPDLSEIRQLDIGGKETLRVSQLSMDAQNSGNDYSRSAEFAAARTRKTYVGPVYFRGHETYVTVAVAPSEYAAEVTAAEVSMRAVGDIISRISVGDLGSAYLVDSSGQLVAHPDINIVLAKRNMSSTVQVTAARAEAVGADEGAYTIADGLRGERVLTVHAPIDPLGWLVFIERPVEETLAPLRAPVVRSIAILVLGLLLALLASIVLAGRMVAPIRLLQTGAARVGRGELDHRIDIRTGDELQGLAEEFNQTAARLEESQRSLEQKVEKRTEELKRSLEQMRALREIGHAVSSTLDLDTVLRTIITNAVELSKADAGGTIYEYDAAADLFEPRANYGISEEIVQTLRESRIQLGETTVGICAARRAPVQIADLMEETEYRLRDLLLRGGVRAILAVPLLREERVVGAMVIRRKTAGEFAPEVLSLLQTFAAQSVLAIENARLFKEVREKSEQLEQELGTARTLQLGMLPTAFPECTPQKPVEIYASMEPAREVGGDLYDFFYAANDRLCFLVGDVSGKGASAAMFMARTRSLVRMAALLWQRLAPEMPSPAQVAEVVNRELCLDNRERMFVTLFLGFLDIRTGVICYANAGHPAPHVLRRGAMERLAGKADPPLGVRRDATYQNRSSTLHPGEGVFICTDGVVEAMNAKAEHFAIERLDAGLESLRALAPADMIRAVKKRVDAFCGDAPKADDVTMLALRWLPGVLSASKTVDVVIANDLGELAQVTAAMERIGAEHAIPARALTQLQVALDEVLSNIIKYAWPHGGAHDIRVRFALAAGEVKIEVIDDGTMFDPLRAAAPERTPPMQRPRQGGVGIHLVKQLVDEIDFARIGDRNHLTLIKRCVVSAPQ